MNTGIRSSCALPIVLALASVPALAQQGQRLPPQSSTNSAVLFCADEIEDQNGGACLQASSIPTFGLLYPYPGSNNVFTPPAFVGGGVNNTAVGYRATVAGGSKNDASGDFATVAGGGGNYYGNTASGKGATVGGGGANVASGYFATIGGGSYNSVSGYYVTVSGGFGNTASGNHATIAGGQLNSAVGDYSFAAGRQASANHQGAFVWGDGQNTVKASSTTDEFSVYCSGGARFFSNSAATAGVLLAPGGGSWTAVSDRAAKENLKPVDVQDVLERVCALPLATWNYRAQVDSIRHMGPMAQDFYAAFGLGLGDKTIDTIDPDGVALAAIQGLNETLAERLSDKDAQIAELRARVERLEALALRLEGQVGDR